MLRPPGLVKDQSIPIFWDHFPLTILPSDKGAGTCPAFNS